MTRLLPYTMTSIDGCSHNSQGRLNHKQLLGYTCEIPIKKNAYFTIQKVFYWRTNPNINLSTEPCLMTLSLPYRTQQTTNNRYIHLLFSVTFAWHIKVFPSTAASIHPKPTFGKGPPKVANILPTIVHLICLHDGIASVNECRVARLKLHSVHNELKGNDVAAPLC